MANVRAVKTGNWNDPTVWNTGALPGVADVVYCNGFVVTINQNITVSMITNELLAAFAVTGGNFNLAGNFNITANILGGSVAGSSSACLQINAGCTSTTIIGNATGGTNASCAGILVSTSGIVINLIGNLKGGSGFVSSANGCFGMRFTTNGTLNMVGNVEGGSNAGAVQGCAGLSAGNTNTTITGTVSGGLFSEGMGVSSGASVDVYGNVMPGSGSSANGIMNRSFAGVCRIHGLAVGHISSTAVAVDGGTTGLFVVDGLEYSNVGAVPVAGRIRFANSTAIVSKVYREDGTQIVLQDINNTPNVIPAANNVRYGVSYNAGGNTGTLRVPLPQSVAFGVQVDHTVGEAVLSFTDWLAALSASADPIAVRLRNVSTPESVGAQLGAALS